MENGEAYRVFVTAAYDTPEAGRRMVSILDRVGEQSGDEFSFDVRLWSADVLNLPAAYVRARDDVARSRLVAVALAGDGRILTGLRDLVEEWSEEHSGRDSALLVLPFCGDTDSPMVAALRLMAERNGLEIICPADPGLGGRFEGQPFATEPFARLLGGEVSKAGGWPSGITASPQPGSGDEYVSGGNGNQSFRF